MNEPESFVNLDKKNPLTDKVIIRSKFSKSAWKPQIQSRDGLLLNSKYSGKPYLLRGESYPHCLNCGKPMQLFLQLNLEMLPEKMRNVHGHGLLQLFYCTNRKPNCDFDCEANCAFEREPGKGKLVRVIQPEGEGEDYDLPLFRGRYPAKTIVSWREVEGDMPDWFTLEKLISNLDLKNSNLEKIFDFDYYAGSYPFTGDKLAGYAYWIQGDYSPKCPQCQTKMQYVYQLDYGGELRFKFGGSGCGHITQCPNHKEIVEFTYEGS